MSSEALARRMLEQEARALLTRIARVRPFALHMPMVTAAAISPTAQTSVENLLRAGRQELTKLVQEYRRWLASEEGQQARPAEAQRRFNILRLRFNAIIRQFDIFASVLTQRSEHETGVWVAGLDDVAQDALALPGGYFRPPPVICYLDANHGAAIRRAYTRLPGGRDNPVAVISVPRERMIGSGIASSLVHEVGHQAAALLGVLPSLRAAIQQTRLAATGAHAQAWSLYQSWISEIFADFWSVARVGVGSTLGLIGVVSLPRAFVFRFDQRDPHPIPWFRVRLSAAIGAALYPHPQWSRIDRAWTTLYPPEGASPLVREVVARAHDLLPDFVGLLLHHRPRALQGRTLREALPLQPMQPALLSAAFLRWRARPEQMKRARPSYVFAVLGQARADGRLTPETESRVLSDLLTHWALRSSMDITSECARVYPISRNRRLAQAM